MTEVIWLVETEYGGFTAEQEFFCWRMALHGNQMRACRESYQSTVGNAKVQNTKAYKLLAKPKIVRRINELIKSHKEGSIDLRAGPWQHYNRFDVGYPVDPGNSLRHMIQEIRDTSYDEQD